MTSRECQRRLAGALNEWQPSVSFDDIVQALQQPRDTVPLLSFPDHRRTVRRWIPVAVAVCLMLMIGVGGALLHRYGASGPAPVEPVVDSVSTVVDIDVNPGIELSINASDRIVTAHAVNDDGQSVLKGLDLKQQPLPTAVQMIFQSMITRGYVADADNLILVTVQNADQVEADRIHGIINGGVDTVMSEHNLSVSVTNQTVEAFDAVTQFAQEYGISNGKAAFILSMAEQQPTLEAAALAEFSFAALAAIAQHQDIPLSELVDYDAEDGLWNRIIGALSNEVAQAETTLGVSLLTPEKAKQLALKGLHNDWIAENALFVRVELVWEKGAPVYRLEFVSLGYLYEYAIDAIDGEFQNPDGSTTTTEPNGTIRSTLAGGGTRTDIDTPPTKATTTTTAPTTTMPTAVEGGISDEKAKSIALFRLGIKEQDATGILVNRLEQYISVRFFYEKALYAFHLDPSNGKSIRTIFLPEDTPVEKYNIDEWDALEIALTQAGLQMDECGEQTIMYGVDKNQTPYIDVTFVDRSYSYSYYYRINGKDGSIITTTSAPLVPDGISEEQAKSIVFTREDIPEQDAHNVSVGRHPQEQELSVSFTYKNQLYCVYVHGETGKVMKSVYLPLDIALHQYRIDEWEAQEIALAHAGVPVEECDERTIMYGADMNGTVYIEVIFATNGYSYYYRIHGEDGSVLTTTIAPMGGNHDAPSL